MSRPELQRSPHDFVTTELEICLTFVRLIQTELRFGWRDAAGRALESAEKGYNMIWHFLPNVENNKQRTEIETKLNSLRRTLDFLHTDLSMFRHSPL